MEWDELSCPQPCLAPGSWAGNGLGELQELDQRDWSGKSEEEKESGRKWDVSRDQIAQGLGKENEIYFLWLNMC